MSDREIAEIKALIATLPDKPEPNEEQTFKEICDEIWQNILKKLSKFKKKH